MVYGALQAGALTYTLATPALGAWMDRGLREEALVLAGAAGLTASYLILGPLPPLAGLLPASCWWTVAAIAIQVSGWSCWLDAALPGRVF
jgi:hypothetical protein